MSDQVANESGPVLPWTIEATVSFVVEGPTLIPEAVTEHIGMTPDRIRHVGDNLRPGTAAPLFAKFGLWVIESRLPPTLGVAEQIAMLLEQVRPVASRFQRFSDGGSVGLCVRLTYRDGTG